MSTEFENMWLLSIVQAYLAYGRTFKRKLEKWFGSACYVGFVDGARKQECNGFITGIDHFILDRLASVKFIFSGPSSKSSSGEVEMQAFLFLCEAIRNKGYNQENFIIASDSVGLVDEVLKWKSDLDNNSVDSRSFNLFHESDNIRPAHINRKFNLEADRLAKEGAKRVKLIACWL